jgi:hypothetical protein
MDPLVTGGIHIAREAFKWLSKQDWGSSSQQQTTPQPIPTFPNTPILSFNRSFDVEAYASGIYAIHRISLILSELNKLKKTHSSLNKLTVLLGECDELKHGSFLELVPNIDFYFEITLKDLVEGQDQGQNLIFLRNKISEFPRDYTAMIIFNTETESIVGLSYLKWNLIYGDNLHIIERISMMAARYYTNQAKNIIDHRVCHEYGATHLEKKYDITPWDYSHNNENDEDYITLRSLYSLGQSDIRHYKSLIKDGTEEIDTLKKLVGYGVFEGYKDGLLQVNF